VLFLLLSCQFDIEM